MFLAAKILSDDDICYDYCDQLTAAAKPMAGGGGAIVTLALCLLGNCWENFLTCVKIKPFQKYL